jgi:RNase P/RNase MRP subunit p29
MITEEELDQFRVEGTRVRVIRDADESNDVRGVVVAWDDSTVLIRKFNKKVVRIDRRYIIQPASEPRISPV